MAAKQRLSASVEVELVRAGQAAVSAGRARNLSAWVNDALRLKVDLDRRMQALDDFLAGYEAEHGEITAEEMREASRRARGRAVVVRSKTGKERHAAARSGRGVA